MSCEYLCYLFMQRREVRCEIGFLLKEPEKQTFTAIPSSAPDFLIDRGMRCLQIGKVNNEEYFTCGKQ